MPYVNFGIRSRSARVLQLKSHSDEDGNYLLIFFDCMLCGQVHEVSYTRHEACGCEAARTQGHACGEHAKSRRLVFPPFPA